MVIGQASHENRNFAEAPDVFVGYFKGKMVVRDNPFTPAEGINLRPFADETTRSLSLAVDF